MAQMTVLLNNSRFSYGTLMRKRQLIFSFFIKKNNALIFLL